MRGNGGAVLSIEEEDRAMHRRRLERNVIMLRYLIDGAGAGAAANSGNASNSSQALAFAAFAGFVWKALRALKLICVHSNS